LLHLVGAKQRLHGNCETCGQTLAVTVARMAEAISVEKSLAKQVRVTRSSRR
jgi:hypothetical protein